VEARHERELRVQELVDVVLEYRVEEPRRRTVERDSIRP
jgi:hypothetical protein